ncbi:MAG: class I poly(R)-hydroxyalkanoic acid synthase, partial [Bacteroidota bacterium]
MTQHTRTPDLSEFTRNMTKAAEQCQRIYQEFMARQLQDIERKPFDPAGLNAAMAEWFSQAAQDPAK